MSIASSLIRRMSDEQLTRLGQSVARREFWAHRLASVYGQQHETGRLGRLAAVRARAEAEIRIARATLRQTSR